MDQITFTYEPRDSKIPKVIVALEGIMDDDFSLEDIVDAFASFLKAMTYTEGSVKQFINTEMVG